MFLRKTMEWAGVVCVAIGLTACADNIHYAKAVCSWQGAPEHALYQSWGNPSSEKKLVHGDRLVTYRVVERENIQKRYSPGIAATRTSPQNNNMLSRQPAVVRHREETFWCETSFEINPVGVIVNTHFHGNNCVATQEGAKKWAFSH